MEARCAKTLTAYLRFNLLSFKGDVKAPKTPVCPHAVKHFIELMSRNMSVGVCNQKQVFRGNLLPTDRDSLKKKKSFLKRLGTDFSDKVGMLSKGGLYHDRFMRDLPNRKIREVFKKREFRRMQIIGQFNVSFIICTLNGNCNGDLFIID